MHRSTRQTASAVLLSMYYLKLNERRKDCLTDYLWSFSIIVQTTVYGFHIPVGIGWAKLGSEDGHELNKNIRLHIF